ncbi:MAG: urea transporter [Bacteroidales bacterium]|nr:urea transporter [Bacteroidales bacterium]MCF8343998.1 urea transporter [Bacteroidales bacterium]MCF8350422.1 urea transporter [Bacteroidales bacterium]MCF8377673.1 urea transporter [Bacteroidales bacterium]MCF8401949.1 urea transporter [Bacteroidales bacterium]
MNEKLKETFPSFLRSITNSYAQVFFSHNQVLAVLLMIVTFFDLYAGIGGLAAVIISNGTACLMGFNRFNIRAGYYGFNSLLVGLGIGLFYQPTLTFYVFLVFVIILTLFITVSLEGVIGKYGLPYLSISFLFGIWMVTLAAREFTALQVSERGIYTLNEMYMMGGISMVKLYEWFNDLNLHESIKIYFRSLGAIFFQYHLFAGLIIAIGLLIYSRIGFLLTLVGFYAAYFFYDFIGADIGELAYSYIGFNYILSALAIGGFFIVASRYSFLWVILLTPLISIAITSSSALFSLFQLSIFSLPFNLIVLLFLYVLKFRERYFQTPEMVAVQQFSPEKNLYTQQNFKKRFEDVKYLPVLLPFWGSWKVTQGHMGRHTHKQDWKHAWDFEIVDEEGSKFKDNGTKPEDFYCYNKPVIAPADGLVVELQDGFDDNRIGDMDLEHNWGNSIVIKHAEKIYSQVSHIRPDSFKVQIGDQVKKGDIIAYVGNSGRSPEPHMHFQLQPTPHIGSKTMDYPISNFISFSNDHPDFHSFDRPKENETVCNIDVVDILEKAFHFVPGKKLAFSVKTGNDNTEKIFEWEVQSDILNNAYLFCKTSGAKAYFRNKGHLHSFINYTGRKKTLLYYFYLAAFRVGMGFYKGLEIRDLFPAGIVKSPLLKTLQDFVAPFYIFIRPQFKLRYVKMDEGISDSTILLKAEADMRIGKISKEKIGFELRFREDHLEEFIIREENRTINAKRIKEE